MKFEEINEKRIDNYLLTLIDHLKEDDLEKVKYAKENIKFLISNMNYQDYFTLEKNTLFLLKYNDFNIFNNLSVDLCKKVDEIKEYLSNTYDNISEENYEKLVCNVYVAIILKSNIKIIYDVILDFKNIRLERKEEVNYFFSIIKEMSESSSVKKMLS